MKAQQNDLFFVIFLSLFVLSFFNRSVCVFRAAPGFQFFLKTHFF